MTEITNNTARVAGWVLYDARCPLCARGARRLGGVVVRRGFRLAPLQRRWVAQRLKLTPGELLKQTLVLTADGRVLGGAEAYVYMAARVWWAMPLAWFARLPGAMGLLHRVYVAVADNRLRISAFLHLRHPGARPCETCRGGVCRVGPITPV